MTLAARGTLELKTYFVLISDLKLYFGKEILLKEHDLLVISPAMCHDLLVLR